VGLGVGAHDVRFADGKLTVKAREADLGVLLRKIAEAAGIAIEIGPGVEGSVTAAFSDEPLEKAIERVLEAAGAKNFAALFDMEQATAKMQKVVVLRNGEKRRWIHNFPEPRRQSAVLRGGAQIEFYEGLFLVVPAKTENAFELMEKYRLRELSSFSTSKASRMYLLQKMGEEDDMSLYWNLVDDAMVLSVSLYGLGGMAAVLQTDRDGRFHYQPQNEPTIKDDLKRIPVGNVAERLRTISKHNPYLMVRQTEYGDDIPYYEGMIIVEFEAGTERRAILELALTVCSENSGLVVSTYRSAYRARATMYFPWVKGGDVFQLINRLKTDTRLADASVYHDGWTVAQGVDPYRVDQWYLDTIRSDQARAVEGGKRDVVVAIVDSGIAGSSGNVLPTHEDFTNSSGADCSVDYERARYFTSSGEEKPGNEYLVDDFGHGTHVSGIVAARHGNGNGISGVAGGRDDVEGVTLLPLNVFDGSIAPANAVLAALEYAVGKADVVNLSLYWHYVPGIVKAVEKLFEAGSVIVAAAGNKTQEMVYREYDPYFKPDLGWTEATPSPESLTAKMLLVGATDQEGKKCDFSNFGEMVAVSAPGRQILSTRAGILSFDIPFDHEYSSAYGASPPQSFYLYGDGTSFSAPQVSGLAALLLSRGASQQTAYSAIANGARDASGTLRSGKMGSGCIDTMNSYSLASQNGAYPAAPSNLIVVDTIIGKRLQWDPVDGLGGYMKYKIYRSVNGASGDFGTRTNFLAYSNTCEYIDRATKGVGFFYRVAAVDASGNESTLSNQYPPSPIDFVLMISRSSNLVYSGDDGKSYKTYKGMVGELVAGLVSKMPLRSTVSILAFQEKVFSGSADGMPVDFFYDEKGKLTNSLVFDALSVSDGRNWQLDPWYLDIGEVLTEVKNHGVRPRWSERGAEAALRVTFPPKTGPLET
jgi:subtilisin family serine protease